MFEIVQNLVPFTAGDWESALPFFSFKTYAVSDIIFSADDKPMQIHFLIEGIGRYFYIDIEGRERNKSLVKAGGAFASITTLVSGEGSPFYTQAITTCTTGAIAYADLITLSEQQTNWAIFLRRVYENLALKKERREAGFLLLSARQRYEEFLSEYGAQSDLVPLKHVAMYIGITDVSLSRIRKEMGLT
ncbi:Crp/Fnr family transcriptional regulator [Kiloniella antarctica]|uniref:Crp/Fnr family transcriptional regulator n=1 Tax=Kiloniella antarctica TaxID=1550907 RepID=A0ABW5BI98_9PROT